MTGDTEHTESGTAPTAGHVPVDRGVRASAPKWEAVREGKTYRVQKDMGNGRIRAVMRPGVGEFRSSHQRVYMTLKGAQTVADNLNSRGL